MLGYSPCILFRKKGQEAFEGWDFPYLAAVSYYGGSYSTFRSICDITNVFFVIDEQTDDEPVDVVTERCEMAMDAILRPEEPRPAGECVIGEATRQCWQRTYPDLPLVIIERFQRTWRKYLDSVIVQAENRSRKHILHPEDYLRERVDNIGIWPSVAIGEQCLRLEIPHECMEHPYLEDMRTWCSELVTLQNDLFSYRKERLANDCDYNAITCVMYHLGLDLHGATREKVISHDGYPSYGADLDTQIAQYTGVLADWIRGNYEWSWYSKRYWTSEMAQQARETRIVPLL
ncbi:hypothetical protein G7054_g8743 [Neopestalotiopsis clavispora]|nr:hypothetical protein G7054_g8743 [Neopestalotiopsis clavispora]